IGRDGKVGHASIWCDIIKEMDRLATQGIDLVSMMQIKIGNGSNTSFWEDRWRGEKSLKEEYPRLYALEVEVGSKWLGRLHCSLGATPRRDSILTTKDCRELPEKLDGLRRGIDILSILCPLCELAVETSKHLFFECAVVKDIFRKICNWWDVSNMEIASFDDWASWILNLRLSSKHKRLLEGVCYGLWWLIWAFRNKKVFGVVPPSKANIFDDIVISSFFWCRYRCKVSFSWVDCLKNPHLVSL
nr:RNA-directed DNA polymerase, eukaryota [Tanacetum cinerariifolium]